jgi:MFS family permease
MTSATSTETVPAPGAGRWNTALRYPAFGLLWMSLLPGTLGMMMASVAFGFVAYQLSGSTTALAVVNLGWGVPMLVLSPAAGLAADRFPRRNVILVTQAVVGTTAVLATVLIATGTAQVWHLVAITTLQGAAFAFNIPARQALIAELVAPADLANAVAIYNSGQNLNRIVGPAVAGALLAAPAVGAAGVFALMAGLYVVVLVLLSRLPPTSVARRGSGTTPEPILRRLGAGFAFVAGHPDLRRLMLLAFLPLLIGMPYQGLLPAVAAQIFHTGAAGLGALSAAAGLGALAGSLVVVSFGRGHRLPRFQLVSGVMFGLALAAFALVGRFVPALFLLALVGAASAAYTSINNTLLMHHAPPEYHGRVMGVYMMSFAAMPLSSLPAAWVADRIGLAPTLLACGLLSAATVAVLAGRPLRWLRPRGAPSPAGVPRRAPAETGARVEVLLDSGPRR